MTMHESTKSPAEAGEDAAWTWLNGHVECDPADRDYSADEMVDAFMAGAGRSDLLLKALERIADEHQYRSGYCQTDITVGPALTAEEAQTVAREALRAQPPAREDAQPVAWRLLAQQQPKPGHKIITLHDDGSGAALLFVHDGGVIDSDGDDYDTIGSPQTRWAYLPDDFEFWCEGLPEEPVTLPAHRVPDHPAPDALRVAVEAVTEIRDGMVAARQDISVDDWIEKADQALAALQAEQKGGA